MNYGIAFTPLIPSPVLWTALAAIVVIAVLFLLILKALSWGPQHGHAVARVIRDGTEGALDVLDGSLYAALHRMEERDWVESEWGLSENNRKAKYYHLTAAGRQQLRSEVSEIRRYVAALFKVLEPAG